MSKFSGWGVALAALLVAHPEPGYSQQVLEGTVVGTKLTHCDFKPGGCAGSLMLETGRATGQVKIDAPWAPRSAGAVSTSTSRP